MATDQLSLELRKRGYSVTKPRQIIFAVLLNHAPLSMNELTKQLSSIDRASVYRTVTLFEELGFVRRINLGWKYKLELSDIFTAHHHHLHCRNCGQVIDIDDNPDLDKAVAELAKQYNFEQVTHELEITGLCPICAKRKK